MKAKLHFWAFCIGNPIGSSQLTSEISDSNVFIQAIDVMPVKTRLDDKDAAEILATTWLSQNRVRDFDYFCYFVKYF